MHFGRCWVYTVSLTKLALHSWVYGMNSMNFIVKTSYSFKFAMQTARDRPQWTQNDPLVDQKNQQFNKKPLLEPAN